MPSSTGAGIETAEAQSWSLSPLWCWDNEWVELYFHSSIFPHDTQMDNFYLFNPFKSEMYLYFTLIQNLAFTPDGT